MRGRVKAAAPGAGLASQPRRDPRAPLMVLPLTLIVGGSSDRAPCVLTVGSGPGLARLQVLSLCVCVRRPGTNRCSINRIPLSSGADPFLIAAASPGSLGEREGVGRGGLCPQGVRDWRRCRGPSDADRPFPGPVPVSTTAPPRGCQATSPPLT